MADSSRKFRNVAACVLVLCCLGAAAWFLLPEGAVPVVDEARVAVRNMTDAALEGVSSAAPASSPSRKTDEGGAQDKDPGREVSAALNDGPRPVPTDPQQELLARVESAMTTQADAAPDGDSASGPVEDRAPAPDAGRRDSVVTPRFVSDMAGWLVAGYVPSHHEGRSGRTSVTLVQANFRYSNSGTLRSVERDPMKSRSSILNYVFTPGMLEALYRMYAPSLLEEMESLARESRRRPLSDALVADMFEVYADRFRRLSVSLEAASSADLAALAGAVSREAAREAGANDDFARAYMALSQARESGNRDEVAIQSRRMAESTRVAGMYAERQERAKNDMIYALRRRAGNGGLSSAELLFLGEWLARRNASPEAVSAASAICLRMAESMHERAQEILHQRDGQGEASEADGGAASAPAQASSPAVPTGENGAPAGDSSAADAKSAATSPAASPAGKSPEGGASGAVSGSSRKETSSASSSRPAFPEVSGPLNFSPAPKTETPSAAAEAKAPAPAETSAVAPAPASSAEAPAKEAPAAPAEAPAKETQAASPEVAATPAPASSSSVTETPAPSVPAASSAPAGSSSAAPVASGTTAEAPVKETQAASPEVAATPAPASSVPAAASGTASEAAPAASSAPAGSSSAAPAASAEAPAAPAEALQGAPAAAETSAVAPAPASSAVAPASLEPAPAPAAAVTSAPAAPSSAAPAASLTPSAAPAPEAAAPATP